MSTVKTDGPPAPKEVRCKWCGHSNESGFPCCRNCDRHEKFGVVTTFNLIQIAGLAFTALMVFLAYSQASTASDAQTKAKSAQKASETALSGVKNVVGELKSVRGQLPVAFGKIDSRELQDNPDGYSISLGKNVAKVRLEPNPDDPNRDNLINVTFNDPIEDYVALTNSSAGLTIVQSPGASGFRIQFFSHLLLENNNGIQDGSRLSLRKSNAAIFVYFTLFKSVELMPGGKTP